MKRISFKAIAAAALLICGLSIANPTCAKPKAPAPKTEQVDTTAKDTSKVDSIALEKYRMECEHEEKMAALTKPGISPIFSEDGPVVICIVFFFLFGVPPVVILWAIIYHVRKRNEREKQLNESLLALAQQGQTITPELVDSLRSKAKDPNKDTELGKSDLSYGFSKMLKGVAFCLIAVLFMVFVDATFGVWFFIPGLLLLMQGLARLATLKYKNRYENPKNDQTEA